MHERTTVGQRHSAGSREGPLRSGSPRLPLTSRSPVGPCAAYRSPISPRLVGAAVTAKVAKASFMIAVHRESRGGPEWRVSPPYRAQSMRKVGHRGRRAGLSEQAGVSLQGAGESHLALHERAPSRGVPHLRVPQLPVLARRAHPARVAARARRRQLGAPGGSGCLTRTSSRWMVRTRRASRTCSSSRR